MEEVRVRQREREKVVEGQTKVFLSLCMYFCSLEWIGSTVVVVFILCSLCANSCDLSNKSCSRSMIAPT